MAKKCEHNIPETLKGSGACRIASEVKKRSGKPLWWCSTHGQEAGMPDGSPLETCPGAWFSAVAADRRVDIDAEDGVFSVWGALPPAIEIGTCPLEAGGVHVHHRATSASAKDVDDSFDIVRVRLGDRLVEVETMSARAFTVTDLLGFPVKAMRCPKPACQAWHIDELKFATHPHAKHQCNQCGRHFWDRGGSISNPLATAYDDLQMTRPPDLVLVNRPLALRTDDYSGIAIWPSSRSIVTNRTTAEDAGVHVHACDKNGLLTIDDTYWPVELDGETLDLDALRALTVQRSLAHGAPVLALPCSGCGASFISPRSGWLEPRTRHECPACGATTKTRLRVFLNPLAAK